MRLNDEPQRVQYFGFKGLGGPGRNTNASILSTFRKNLYVWCLESRQLVKVLDAHFGRIIQLEALTIGNWNCAITSSIDRSVKVWNINNIFEQVHVIDRHELQIDHIRFDGYL